MFVELLAGLPTPLPPFGQHLLYVFDLFGTVVFASTGALVAHEQRRSGLSALLYAGLTALGGGTLRDILLGEQPVFWMRSPTYLCLALTAGLITFFLAHNTSSLRRPQFWLAEGLSLGAFTVVGIQATLSSLAMPDTVLFSGSLRCVLPLLMGLTTGVAGGLVRDVVDARHPCVLQHPSCVFASLMGGFIYLLLLGLHLVEGIAAVGAIATVICSLAFFGHTFYTRRECEPNGQSSLNNTLDW